jgi:integrase
MALVLRPEARHWAAAIKVNGKLCRFPLTVLKEGKELPIPIEGRRPSSLLRLEEGDRVFLHSYHSAKAAHDRLAEEIKSRWTEEDLTKRLIKAKTGKGPQRINVSDLPSRWRHLPRKRKPSPSHLKNGSQAVGRFVEYLQAHAPGVVDVLDVTEQHFQGFLAQEDARGLSARSWNASLKFLRSVITRVAPHSPAYIHFLRDLPLRDEHTVHRKPFSDDEMESILRAVREDTVLRGPVITAMCTGMRKGDCCTLAWKSVDLQDNFLDVRTTKTGETCQIPILPLFREELLRRPAEGKDVFPEAAALYRDPNRRHLLDTRFNTMMRNAGFLPESVRPKKKSIKDRPELKRVDNATLREKAGQAIASQQYQQRKAELMLRVLNQYLDGKSLPAISQELSISKGTVSGHLNALEELTGCEVLRRPKRAGKFGARVAECEDQRLKRGSIRGWHSFRTGFVTRALNAGMSEELVRRVTGHTTVEVVREHYHQPDREDFRREFERVAPRMFSFDGAKPSQKEQIENALEILKNMKAKTWRADRAKAMDLVLEMLAPEKIRTSSCTTGCRACYQPSACLSYRAELQVLFSRPRE